MESLPCTEVRQILLVLAIWRRINWLILDWRGCEKVTVYTGTRECGMWILFKYYLEVTSQTCTPIIALLCVQELCQTHQWSSNGLKYIGCGLMNPFHITRPFLSNKWAWYSHRSVLWKDWIVNIIMNFIKCSEKIVMWKVWDQKRNRSLAVELLSIWACLTIIVESHSKQAVSCKCAPCCAG